MTLCLSHDIQGDFGEGVVARFGVVGIFKVVMMKSSRKYRNSNLKSIRISLRSVWCWKRSVGIWFWISASAQRICLFYGELGVLS